MRVLIAGCGYVGLRLAERLHQAGHDVFGIRRSPAKPEPFLSWITGDIRDPDTIPLPDSPDVVVLSAGLRRDTGEQYRRLFAEGYGALIRRFENSDHPPRRLVMVSTTGVLAEQNGGWVDESSPINREHLPGSYYAVAEDLVTSSAIPFSIVRLSGIYGPERIRLIREVKEGRARLFPSPALYLNQIHADDAAGVLAHVIGLSQPEPLYIATDREPSDRNDVLRWIADRTGVASPPMADETTERPIRRSGNKRCRCDRLIASGYGFMYPTYREGYAALLRGP